MDTNYLLTKGLHGEYDVAKFAYELLGDVDKHTLRVELSEKVEKEISKYTSYLYELSHNSTHEIDHSIYHDKATDLSEVCRKLKTTSYKDNVIKEYFAIVNLRNSDNHTSK